MVNSQNFYDLVAIGKLLPRKKRYYDSLNRLEYICHAPQGSLLTDNVWMVLKTKYNADGTLDEQRSTANFENLATDIATVEALTYL